MASETRIPPSAAPITTPRETPFEPVLVGVVAGIEKKLEFMLAAKNQLVRYKALRYTLRGLIVLTPELGLISTNEVCVYGDSLT